jgi:hypothetical protein
MKRFYTHVLNRTTYARDLEGQQFRDLEEACQTTRRSARSMVCEEIYAGRDPVRLEFHICNEGGALLAKLCVGAIVSGLEGGSAT